MELKVTQETVTINEVVFEGNSEQPIDLDINLPDYCPDISRILKCQLTPMILVRQVAGDRLHVEGKTGVRILYLDDQSTCVRNFDHSLPFSAEFPLKVAPEMPIVRTGVEVNYVNCRATSQRKLNIHGSFNLSAKVISKSSNHVLTDAEMDGVQLLRKPLEINNVVNMVDRQFVIGEMLELGMGKPPVGTILRVDAVAMIQDYKPIANKTIVKGEVFIKVLYVTEDDGGLENLEYTLPFSQIIDIEGLDEDCTCDTRGEVLSTDMQTRLDSEGSMSLISAEIKVSVSVTAYRPARIELVSDAFSTRCEMDAEYSKLQFESSAEVLREDGLFKEMFELPEEEISAICDVWTEPAPAKYAYNDGRMAVNSSMKLCVLALNMNGYPVYFERIADVEHLLSVHAAEEEMKCDLAMTVTAVGYNLSGANQIEIRLEYMVEGSVCMMSRQHALVNVIPHEDRPLTRANKAALTLYYADKGERVWDIARKYCTSMDAVIEENELDIDTIAEPCMLMIPNV